MRHILVNLFFVLSALSQGQTVQLASLVSTERAFASATRHIGVRNGFLTFFADDAIALRPVLGPYKEQLRSRAQPPQPLPSLLLWTPTEGDVSRDGDLGWLTGPSAAKENRPDGKIVYKGQYFSVWKKQADGTWKVLLDAGIEVPALTGDPETAPFQPHALFSANPDTNVRGSAAELADAEKGLNEAYGRSGAAAAHFYAASARYHADSLMPITGNDAVRIYLRQLERITHQSFATGCSSSGDLGYSYGEYLDNGNTMYYIRAWKYVKNEGWRVVVEWNG